METSESIEQENVTQQGAAMEEGLNAVPHEADTTPLEQMAELTIQDAEVEE
jgi:hypothetical protein